MSRNDGISSGGCLACWIAACWIGVGLTLAAAAGLRFESDRMQIDLTPDQTEVQASFAFVNEGTQAARIESVVSDCACLKAEAPEGEIAPGAGGCVRGFFKAGNFRGMVEKQLVASVRQGGQVTRFPLTVAIVVPELIRVEPATLTWITGEEPVEKTFHIRILWQEEIRLLRVECAREEFRFRIETITPGREYRVHAKPNRADSPCIGLCSFVTDCKFERFRVPYGFVHMRQPAPAGR